MNIPHRPMQTETNPHILAARFTEHAIAALKEARRHLMAIDSALDDDALDHIGRAYELCRDAIPGIKRRAADAS